jgi:sugar phosphate isomerase/epimerase
VEALKGGIDQAAELGCNRMAFLTGPDPGDADRERALDALADSLFTLCAYGQDKGVALTLETFDRDVDKKALIGPSAMAAPFAARIRERYPDFGLLYDLSHLPLLHESVEGALQTLKDYLVHIHVGNGVATPGKPGYGDLHPRFGFPNSANDVPELKAFLKGLFDIGYLGKGREPKPWVGFEVKPQPGESGDLIMANSKRAWRQAWADLEV